MSNAKDAYGRILKAIITSELKPGEPVAEIQVAERFGFGRTPVREAIKRLENEGFIASSEHKKRVYILFPKDIDEIFTLKQAIESMVSAKAAALAKPQDKKDLIKLLGEINALKVDANNERFVQKWLDMDVRFHRLLFKMAQNVRAENIIDNLNLQFRRIKLGMMVLEGRVEKAIEEHSEIGKAVVAGDSEAASRLMYDHLEKVKHTIISLMETFYYTP